METGKRFERLEQRHGLSNFLCRLLLVLSVAYFAVVGILAIIWNLPRWTLLLYGLVAIVLVAFYGVLRRVRAK